MCLAQKRDTFLKCLLIIFCVAPKIGVHNIRAVYFLCMTPCQLWNIKLQNDWQHLRVRKRSSYLEQSAIATLSYFMIHDVVCFHPKYRPLWMSYFNCVRWISRPASTHYWGYICVTFVSHSYRPSSCFTHYKKIKIKYVNTNFKSKQLYMYQGIVFVLFMRGNLLLGSWCKCINGILILKTKSNISSLILLSTL